MVGILCPFCEQEFELEEDLSGEYLCPTCDETVLYENNELLDKPIVLGKYHDFFEINNIVGVISSLYSQSSPLASSHCFFL